jgi:hypothetical protein
MAGLRTVDVSAADTRDENHCVTHELPIHDQSPSD